MNLANLRTRVLYQAGLLGLVALLASALLALGDLATREMIASNKAEDLKESLSQVIPPERHDHDLLDDVLNVSVRSAIAPRQVYRAHLGGRITALAYGIVGEGYAGPIEAIMGVDAQGRILGIRILSHRETPGLGDKIEHRKSDWILHFNGRSLADPPPQAWAVKKDGGAFDQLTGATITPRAVVHAVKEGLEFFAAHQSTLLGKGPQKPLQSSEVTHGN